MTAALSQDLLCGRFRRRPPGLGHSAPPALRPFDALLPVVDEISGRQAWLLPVPAAFVGNEVDRSYFIMGANQAAALACDLAIPPAFVDRDEDWFCLGYWHDDLENHPAPSQDQAGILPWALGVAKNLQELHALGKQHGLLQPGAVVRAADGRIRVWGGALYELVNKARLAERAQKDAAEHDLGFVPALLQGTPVTLQDELAGWAMTVASRWVNASGPKALARLEQERTQAPWADGLKRLVAQCLDNPQAQGIQSAADLVTRLEVICDGLAEPESPNLERVVHDFGPIDGSMPSLESVDFGGPGLGANGAPVGPRAGTIVPVGPGRRKSTASAFAPQDPGNWNPPPAGRNAGKRPKGRLFWWGRALLCLGALAGGAWLILERPASLMERQQSSTAAAPAQPQDPAQIVQAAAPADGRCPAKAAPLPGGTCMDRFEYPGEGKAPRVSLTKNQAELLCQARNGRLCQPKEWRSACAMGRPNLSGCQLRERLKDRSKLRVASKSDCTHAGRFYDLLGNAAEWVTDGSALGGDAKTLRAQAGCEQGLSPKKAKTSGFSVGFRCCYGEPPQ